MAVTISEFQHPSSVLDLNPSTPVEQFLTGPQQHRRLGKALLAVYLAARRSPKNIVNWHKERLGPQSFCWKGSEFLFYVWERSGWRLMVANGKGICLEVTRVTNNREGVRQSWRALREYLDALGPL